MPDNKQVLDVTYGTFSCRLEGFDDSVATLKQIAEFLSALGDQDRLPDPRHTTIDISALARLTGAVSTDNSPADQPAQLRLRHPNFSPPADIDDLAPEDESVAARMERIRAVITQTADASDDVVADPATAMDPVRITPLAQRLADLAQRKALQANDMAPIDDDEIADAIATNDDTVDVDDLSETAEPYPASPQDDDGEADVTKIDATEEPALAEQPVEEVAEPDISENEVPDENIPEDPASLPVQRADLSPTADSMVQRLLSQTDDEINAPALRSQRLSFAQLKAASIATAAARQMGDDGDDDAKRNESYRDDLDDLAAKEVTPSLQDDDEDTPFDFAADLADEDDDADPHALPPLVLTQPVKPSPLPPLRLVAAQRVTEPASAEQRLRQIVSRIDTTDSAPISHPDFVNSYELTELADMIEATAAYINFVQGQPDFSRFDVMRLLRNLPQIDVERSERIRMLGRLVRQQRVIRLDNGQLRVADDTPYRPKV